MIPTLSRIAVLLVLSAQPIVAQSQPQGPDVLVDVKTDETGTTIDFKMFVPARTDQIIDRIPQGYARDRTAGCLYVTHKPLPDEYADWTGDCDEQGYATGQGTLVFTYPSGATGQYVASMDGQFRAGILHGTGRLVRLNGSVTAGTHIRGQMNGQGSSYNGDTGSTYVGGYLNGKRHGLGKATRADGIWVEGIWRSGEFVQTLRKGG